MGGIDNSIIDLCKQLELYIQSDYYKNQISIGAFSTRFNKFWLENERAKDHLFMIDVIKGEANEKQQIEDELEDIKQSRDTWEEITHNLRKVISDNNFEEMALKLNRLQNIVDAYSDEACNLFDQSHVLSGNAKSETLIKAETTAKIVEDFNLILKK